MRKWLKELLPTALLLLLAFSLWQCSRSESPVQENEDISGGGVETTNGIAQDSLSNDSIYIDGVVKNNSGEVVANARVYLRDARYLPGSEYLNQESSADEEGQFHFVLSREQVDTIPDLVVESSYDEMRSLSASFSLNAEEDTLVQRQETLANYRSVYLKNNSADSTICYVAGLDEMWHSHSDALMHSLPWQEVEMLCYNTNHIFAPETLLVSEDADTLEVFSAPKEHFLLDNFNDENLSHELGGESWRGVILSPENVWTEINTCHGINSDYSSSPVLEMGTDSLDVGDTLLVYAFFSTPPENPDGEYSLSNVDSISYNFYGETKVQSVLIIRSAENPSGYDFINMEQEELDSQSMRALVVEEQIAGEAIYGFGFYISTEELVYLDNIIFWGAETLSK